MCDREPAKPSTASRQPELKGDLDSIVAMALRKEPQLRYSSAEELAADVRRHLTGQPVRAVRPTVRYRARKFARRQGARLAAAMVFVALLGLILWLNVQRRSPGQSGNYRRSPIAEANEYFERAAAVEKVDLDEERIARLLQRAVELDPNFTAARSRYGFYLLGMVDHGRSNDPKLLDRAEAELRRAGREDPNLASNYSFLSVLSYYRRQWDQMEMQGNTAVRLDPRDIDASMSLVPLLRLRGDYPQAIRLCQQVLQRDATFLPARGNLADLYRFSGDLARCVREMERIPEQERAPPVLASLAGAYLDRGELAKARQRLEKTSSMDRGNYYLRLAWALLMAREGNAQGTRRELDADVLRWVDLYPEGPVSAAEVYSVLGDTGNALSWLDKGVRGGDYRKSWFLLDPHLANLRQDPRFQRILDSIPRR